MNVLFLSTRSPYPLISGHCLRTYHTLRGAAQRHKVILVTFVQKDIELDEKNLSHLRNICHKVFLLRIKTDINKFYLISGILKSLFTKLPFVAYKYETNEFREVVSQIIKTEEIDMVHVDMLPLSQYCDEFKNKAKILVNHNIENIRLYRWFKEEKKYFKKVFLWLQWRKLKKYETRMLQMYNAVIFVSDADKTMALELKKLDNYFVVPNGTDTNYFMPKNDEVLSKAIAWFGHMDSHTNADAVKYFLDKVLPINATRVS